MAEEPLFVSWKGAEGATFKGMTRLTPASRGEGRLRMIKNGYVSPDGTEIRQMPGFKCVVDLTATGFDAGTIGFPQTDTGYTRDVIDYQNDEPSPPVITKAFTRPTSLHCFKVCRGRLQIIGESDFKKWYVLDASGIALSITDVTDNGGFARLTLDGTPDPNQIAANATVFIENTGLSYDGSNHGVTATATTTVDFGTVFSDAGSGLTGYLYTVRPGTDVDALTVYTVEQTPDDSDPVDDCRPATVANRLRDWGVSKDSLSDIQGDNTHLLSFPREGWHGTAHHGVPRRKQKVLPYRLVPDVAGDRTLLAVRGYGVIFQCPVIIPPADAAAKGITSLRYNSIYDKPRCLGLPKAVMLDPTDQSGMVFASRAGNPGVTPAGTYKVQCGYRDEGTGEKGLPSEVMTLTVSHTASPPNLHIFAQVLVPGYLLSESLATAIDFYVSKVNGATLGFVFSVKVSEFGIAGASTGFSEVLMEVHFPTIVDADVDLTRIPPTDTQMPMGANAVKTIRGTTIFGGTVGDTGVTDELEAGQAVFYPNQGASWTKKDEILVKLIGSNAEDLSTPWGVAGGMLPPAYVGNLLFSETMFHENIKTLLLDIIRNTDAAYAGSPPTYFQPNKWFPRIKMEHSLTVLGLTTLGNSSSTDAYLILPRGLFWWGEQGNPNLVPAINQGFLDSDANDDIEAIGRFRNFAILCTRRQAFRVQWGQTLRQDNAPQLFGSEEGCISGVSMVEGDDFLGWMSDRGPYGVMRSGVGWFGRPLKPFFESSSPRYRRESDGRMGHSWSAYDNARDLIFMGVRVADGGYAAATNGAKSKFACDEVLVYNVAQNAWSIWVPPIAVLWMDNLNCADGVTRLCFLGDDNRIYALDDSWADSNAVPITATANAAGTDATLFTADAVAFNHSADPFANGDHTRVGMNFALYKGINWPTDEQGQLIGHGTITTITSTTVVVLSVALSWKTADILLVGVMPPMEVETNSENYLKNLRPVKVESVGIRYSQFLDEKSWVEILAESTKTTSAVNLQRGSDTQFTRLEQTADEEKVAQRRMRRGGVRGDESDILLRIIGGPQVRLQDVVTEVKEL